MLIPTSSAEDARVERLLRKSRAAHVDSHPYVKTMEKRPACTAKPVIVVGKKGMLVKKVFDRGSAVLSGALGNVLFDQVIKDRDTNF